MFNVNRRFILGPDIEQALLMTRNSYSAFRFLGYPCTSEPRGNGNPRVPDRGRATAEP